MINISNYNYAESIKNLHEALLSPDCKPREQFLILLNIIQQLKTDEKHNKLIEVLSLTNIIVQSKIGLNYTSLNYIEIINELSSLDDSNFFEWALMKFNNIIKSSNSSEVLSINNKIILEAKDYLTANYSKDISLHDIAKHVNISPQYFSKLIKKTTGSNFVELLSMIRIDKSKELFNSTSMTVKEVCYLVGYKDPNYFSRIFKKRTSMTPSEYIKLVNNNFTSF